MLRKIKCWLDQALDGENFEKYDVKATGTANKTDGFLGDLLFVSVKGVTKNGTLKKIELALKMSKENEALRKDLGGAAFQREFCLYENVLPVFEEFQKGKQIKESFVAYPKCYKCLKLEKRDVIVLENLRSQGYEIHNKKICLNLAHTRAVLQQYAKFHALSFALKDQNRKKFESVASPLTEVWFEFWSRPAMVKNLKKSMQGVSDLLKKYGNDELYRTYVKLSEGAIGRFLAIDDVIEEQVVITHGDCWNNNFLFRYDDNSKRYPASLVMIDFQMCYPRSPAFDLCYFLFLASATNWKMYDRLLTEYHEHLSDFLTQLGTSPEVYTFDDLTRDWKKWWLFGVVFAPFALKVILADDRDFGDLPENGKMEEYFDIEIPNETEYYERISCVIEYLKDHL